MGKFEDSFLLEADRYRRMSFDERIPLVRDRGGARAARTFLMFKQLSPQLSPELRIRTGDEEGITHSLQLAADSVGLLGLGLPIERQYQLCQMEIAAALEEWKRLHHRDVATDETKH